MSQVQISQRAFRTPPSPIRKLSSLAQQAASSGTRVYHLNIGQPDIRSPKEYFDGLARYKSDIVAYEQSQGNAELTKAWSEYMNRSLGLSTKREQFLITTGASEALIFLFMVCCDPGDEVIIFDPTYANYIGFAAIAGVTLVPLHTSLDQNFALPNEETIARAITTKTRAILLCSPNNPTGTVYERPELEMLLALCNRHKLFFIVDETYREFVYDQAKPLSVLNIDPENPRVIIVDSLSKRFSLCGARIGALISNSEEVLAASLNLAQARLASPTLEQFAAAQMLNTITPSFVDAVRDEYEQRRNVLLSALSEVKGVVAHKPRGAFYTVVRLPVKNAEHFASFMLREFQYESSTTFVAPASGFYMRMGQGESKARIAYVLKSADISKAIKVLGEGLAVYNKKK